MNVAQLAGAPEPLVVALLETLDAGERAAIQLALGLNAERALIDERRASAFAARLGLHVTGTLGLLSLAARDGLIDLRQELNKLMLTNFRYSRKIIAELVANSPRPT